MSAAQGAPTGGAYRLTAGELPVEFVVATAPGTTPDVAPPWAITPVDITHAPRPLSPLDVRVLWRHLRSIAEAGVELRAVGCNPGGLGAAVEILAAAVRSGAVHVVGPRNPVRVADPDAFERIVAVEGEGVRLPAKMDAFARNLGTFRDLEATPKRER